MDCKKKIAVFEWVPQGKKPSGTPRKKWLDGIEDILRMDIENEREITHDRDR